jgi:hypothetical protein
MFIAGSNVFERDPMDDRYVTFLVHTFRRRSRFGPYERKNVRETDTRTKSDFADATAPLVVGRVFDRRREQQQRYRRVTAARQWIVLKN